MAQEAQKQAETEYTVMDPVCGMEVTPDAAAGRSYYNGQYFYFCSEGCKEEFDENPAAFAGD